MTIRSGKTGQVKGNASITLIVVLVAAALAALYFGSAIGQGSYKQAYIMTVLFLAVPTFFFIGDKYWVGIPFAITCGLPAIPIFGTRSVDVGEFWLFICLAAFALRFPFTPKLPRLVRKEAFPLYLYVAWAFLIFCLNPTGLAIFGSSSFGGRFYFKIGLAMIAFVLISSQTIDEKLAKRFCVVILIATIVSTVWQLGVYFVTGRYGISDASAGDGFYSWNQSIHVAVGGMAIYFYGKNSLIGWFKRIGMFVPLIVLLLLAMAAFAGKRQILVLILVYPFVIACLRREVLFAATWLGIAGISAILLVGGQGTMFDLPLSVQRSISFLPGDWDGRVLSSADNNFRRTLNRLAAEKIENDPILGKGYNLSVAGYDSSQTRLLRGEHFLAAMMAEGSSWHNTWLGISADFGIPAAVLWAFVWLKMLLMSYQLHQRADEGSNIKHLAGMLFLLVVSSILRSWTTGHSSLNVWTDAWQFALIIICRDAVIAQEQQRAVESVEEKTLGSPDPSLA